MLTLAITLGVAIASLVALLGIALAWLHGAMTDSKHAAEDLVAEQRRTDAAVEARDEARRLLAATDDQLRDALRRLDAAELARNDLTAKEAAAHADAIRNAPDAAAALELWRASHAAGPDPAAATVADPGAGATGAVPPPAAAGGADPGARHG
jgi:hypothetical protein